MKVRNILVLAAMLAMSATTFGQQRLVDGRLSRDEMNQIRSEARAPITFAKKELSLAPSLGAKLASPNVANLATIPSPYDDPDSFGQNVKFFGSLYAGTVYIYHSCAPQVLLDELGLTLAADDKCIVHNPPSAPMNQTQVLYDPAWEYTIPKNTLSNTLYIVTNNNPGYDAFDANGNASPYTVLYSPVVTFVSTALNDPLAIDPSTGLPMNGQYTVSLNGTNLVNRTLAANDFVSEYKSYANVAGRGFSRSYWRAVGLPDSVINKLLSRKMSLRFGIRVRASGAVNFGQFYYTMRMLGD
ncbi:MAG TPA: hypothetical protein PLR83_04030 [Pyrinomonadaceae bacterium]|nr:hypothetical protein [Pyrinomonadaceae bacterium]